MTVRLVALPLLAATVLGGCGGSAPTAPAATPGGTASATPTPTATTSGSMALFYQDVTPDSNAVKTGLTADGRLVDSSGVSVLNWQARGSSRPTYGDPVFSRLANGRWAMTAWSGAADPRGAAGLMYHEAACPAVDENAVIVVSPSTNSTCASVRGVVGGKTSQLFEVDGGTFVLTSTEGRIRLLKIADATRTARDLRSICERPTAATSISQLAWGEATVILDASNAQGLRLSDTGIARRRDGTWVVFVKGIAQTSTCVGGSLCELCARSIYRTTSRDLITWSSLEKVVDEASIPEAATFPDGSVALYWQSFQETCAAQDLMVAARAPIRMAFETASGALGPTTAITFPKEAFEANKSLHYPTNANPILLPDANAAASLNACLAR